MDFPLQLNAGFDTDFLLEDLPYSADDGWTLKFILRPVDSEPLEFEAAPEPTGTAYRFFLSSSSTAHLPGGLAAWQCAAERPDGETPERRLIASGRIEIVPDFSNVAADPRSFVERMLAGIDAALEGRVDDPACEMEYDGRKVRYMSTSELLRLRGYFLELLPGNEPTHELIRFKNA